jgi:hypothetical protein
MTQVTVMSVKLASTHPLLAHHKTCAKIAVLANTRHLLVLRQTARV